MSSSNLATGRGVFAITPSDTTNFAKRARNVWVGGGGNVNVLCEDGSTATLPAVPTGSWLGVECVRINAVGTTATGLVGIV